VLPADARKKLFTPHVPTRGGDVYAYGWGVEQTRRNTTVISHNGGNGIFAADFRRNVDEKTVISVMTTASVPATAIAPRQIEALVFADATVPMPPAIVEVPPPRAPRWPAPTRSTGAARSRSSPRMTACARGLTAAPRSRCSPDSSRRADASRPSNLAR
jgi:hypothetical protein